VPELPDITVYLEALERRILGRTLVRLRVASPFLLRSIIPAVDELAGRRVTSLRRLGKRIAFGFEGDRWAVLHLMIAGRLQWREAGVRLNGRQQLAAMDFEKGSLVLTEAGTKKRASLYLLEGGAGLLAHRPAGIEVLDCTLEAFRQALTSRNHTLKRALTDPELLSGIGNAYSDEILHAARLSPVALSQRLSEAEIGRLHRATQDTLKLWIERLRAEAGDRFPTEVTAFRKGMAVHGRFGLPCPVCGTRVQRIRYSENETNYCPNCQTGGRVLADRSLSLLLKGDWPRTPEEWEERHHRTH
jgi:formamidopyrimidine-DNA glycosylase